MKRAIAVACVVLGSTVVSSARADTANQVAAQKLFDQASELSRGGRYAEACPKFAESLRLERGTGGALWLADCYEKLGKTASAWTLFHEAAATAAIQHDPRESVARRRAALLEPHLTKLVVLTRAEVGAVRVERDGVVLETAELNVPIPVDPGVHTVSATAPGRRPWRVTLTLASQTEPITIDVPALEIATPAPEVSHTAVSSPPTASSWNGRRIAGVSLAGASIVGAGVGLYLGLAASSTYQSSNRDGHCLPDNECDAVGKAARSGARSLATGSTIAFVTSGVALASGAVLYFTAGGSRVAIAPAVASSSGGFVVTRAW